ncbi:hypothetical protein SOX05_08725 [Pseudomonas putida]|uniref:hypothetical protein n=1 Tax=Pseudomonas putida TaxID=303 RepID=UPI001BAF81DA|nr:hypothetical protein [Pseudomonas putida]MDY4309950.1 hypothetical protein [Pseudomonas putida]MDY4319345.1 hypothetical protein [Pseudomonas putida]MDY4352730.1 hypothetical protein [Pseudomonas putida]QUG90755.1 hypothetical protein GR140_19005 [Pseudomonas putida]
MIDIKGQELNVDDRILYATTHGNMQFGRIISIDGDVMKVRGKDNKRELRIKDSSKQVYLISIGYYKVVKRRGA